MSCRLLMLGRMKKRVLFCDSVNHMPEEMPLQPSQTEARQSWRPEGLAKLKQEEIEKIADPNVPIHEALEVPVYVSDEQLKARAKELRRKIHQDESKVHEAAASRVSAAYDATGKRPGQEVMEDRTRERRNIERVYKVVSAMSDEQLVAYYAKHSSWYGS